MNWAKENKFLAAYCVVMLIGVGVLGYKVYAASSAYEEANARYTTKASSYNTLRRLAPFPNAKNLAVFTEQKREAAGVVTAFQAELAKREYPLEPMSPQGFQDALKKGVSDVRTKAAAANMTIATKDKFYLGFGKYETQPPDTNATAALGRDLKAIEWVVNQLISTPIGELRGLTRPEIPEEKGKAASPATKPGPGGKPGAAGRDRSDLVNVHTFDVVILCKQHQLAKFLNTVIDAGAPQFFIPRSVRIVNTNQKAVARVDPAAAAPAAVAPAGTPLPGQAPAPATVGPAVAPVIALVGEESVEATIRLEIVDFADPVTTAAK